MEVKQEIVETINGQKVEKYTIINDNGVQVGLLTLGATWQEFLVPDDKGGQKNLIIGFDKPSDYLKNPLCAGQSIGRVAGRINQGKVNLDGKEIQLPQNEKGNTLHGGPQGFHQQIWTALIESGQNALSVVMTYDAKEEIDHFPGDMQVEVRFTLDNANRFTIVYTGKNATKTTLFNPTNHVYFNLGNRQDLSQHTFTLAADRYLETRDDLIPTGKFIDVAGTAYDFQTGQNLGEAIADTGGLDDAFLVNASLDKPCGELKDEESGDSVHLYSDRDAWVVYSMGGIPEGIYPARDKGKMAKEFEALALEAQFLPDAINHDGFGDIVLPANTEKTYTIAFEYHKG
ncbi:aldose epimerase family protein [Streptococcus gallolyticus]|jgi:aldose 1-epimerase|uniref:aldose epimerase family protein n=1 Tax=Streptococcus gallolyticus TaxID=315405 RepID=UPI0008916E72|nr:aldose epimerase family protein [Streptococcus gallolyticus]SDK16901.1 aldose 1-epimerase [Streptococcus gallolyticus]SDL66129.1 aldose 1-epimerase [Streptococcus gallolyticus]